MEKDEILAKLRYRLESDYGCIFQPGHKMHFFETPHFVDRTRQLECFALDSAYAAIAASEVVVRFRAYVQLKEYRARLNGGWIFGLTEAAEIWARSELESILQASEKTTS